MSFYCDTHVSKSVEYNFIIIIIIIIIVVVVVVVSIYFIGDSCAKFVLLKKRFLLKDNK